ncbi:MAG: helix-turn-helix domain-containing protein [Clostridia bacterium]|nr:helix-turn-helix domain-containing protein [Clostridia bacterium]
MTFSQKLIALRRRDGLTQTGLARAVGVTRQAVYLWEKGLSYPEAEALLALRRLFGVSIDALLVEEISLDAGAEAGPTIERQTARPAKIRGTEPVETERPEAKKEETPSKKAEIYDPAADAAEEPAFEPTPKHEPQSAPLRAKVEPSRKMKSGSLLDLFGAFWKRKK